MNKYRIDITFKDRKTLSIEAMAADDLRDTLAAELETKTQWVRIGDYFVPSTEVLSWHITGDPIVEQSLRKQKENDVIA